MEKQWTTVIKSKNKLFDLKLKELWKYRDLIVLFVKRNFKTRYKQTVLGPLWFIIQPLFTTVVYTIVFGNFAGLPTDGVPQFIFYMAGNVPWLYFSSCINSTSSTFTANAGVFGKVYFPRMVAPLSTVITCMIDFAIQFVMLVGFEIYFILSGSSIGVQIEVLLLPVLLIQMALIGVGCGTIISSLTTKYRDLQVLVGFGVQLWMYATPIVYSSATLSPTARSIIMLNPISPIIDTFRYAMLGSGSIPWGYWGISWIFTAVVVFVGLLMFNKVEKTFMDTV